MIQFSCEKALLQDAVAVASRTVAQKSSIPALEGLLLQTDDGTLTISGYNMQAGIRTHVSADITGQGKLVLNARLFGDIIRKMPDDVMTFSADERQMVRLTCGDADFEILGLSADDYPELPEVEDDSSISIQQKLLRDMIEQTSFAVSTNESRPVHTGALFEVSEKGLAMVAVDGFRLAIRREPLEKIDGGAFSFVTPGSALNEVEKICGDTEDPATVTLGKRHILFEVGSTELICRRLEGEFLDYRNAIPRKNPISVLVDTKTMYIGSTSSSGLHHLVYEIVDNSIDEALAGYCTEITVEINEGDTITVTDNGRGIPVDIQSQTGRPALEVVFSVLHAGGKFGGGGYKVSGGLHGVGASVVNALSEWLVVQVHKDGKIYEMKFSRGGITQEMKIVGETTHTGTMVTFKPDPQMFEDTVYQYDILHTRMREEAFLNAGLRIRTIDHRVGQEQSDEMCYEGGIREFVSWINKNKDPLHESVIYMKGMRLIALQGLNREKLETEYKELEERIAYYQKLLASDEMIRSVLKEELTAIRDRFGDGRKTEIQDVEDDIDIEDLIEEEECVFTLSAGGYIKRVPVSTYRSQNRGGRGITATALRDEDVVSTVFTASTHDYMLFFTNTGRVHRKKGYQIPEASRTARGTNIVNILPVDPGERVTAMTPILEELTPLTVPRYLAAATASATAVEKV